MMQVLAFFLPRTSYQFQFHFPGKFFNLSFSPERAAAIRMAFRINHLAWYSAPEKFCAFLMPTVLCEAPLNIGSDTGVQTGITGFNDIDIPLRNSVQPTRMLKGTSRKNAF